jgi:cell division septum initiation protein DivIVA
VVVFTDQVASGALVNVAISQLRYERRRLEGKIKRLRMQHTEAVRDKSVAENKSQNLMDKMAALEKENEYLGHWLNDEKDVAVEAKMEAETARAEAQADHKRTTELELKVKGMRAYHERVEATTRVGVDQAHTLFVDAYYDLGA